MSALGALVGGPLVGLGVGLLIVALLPRHLRRVDREWLLTAVAACLLLGLLALETLR